MVERFFDELRRGVPTGTDKASDSSEQSEKIPNEPKAADESFLAPLSVIRQIVCRKVIRAKRDDAPDLIQKVVLQLLTWRENNPKKHEEMSAEEWQSFASKAAHNAVNRRLSSNEDSNAPLDEAGEIAGDNSIAGNTQAELASLLSIFWQGICQLSLRQRRALLLGSDSLIVLLRFHGISNQTLGEILEIKESELLEIINRLPLKDAQIAQFIADRDGGEAKNRNISSLTQSIKKARHKARARLQKLLSE